MRTPILIAAGAFLLGAPACLVEDQAHDLERFLSPLDGQTAWPVGAPLTVYAEALDLPVDYPVDQTLRVTDVETGEELAGWVEPSTHFLRFHPNSAFESGRTYRFTVDVADGVPHGPSLGLPRELRGDTHFSTTHEVNALGVSATTPSELCVIFSRPLNDDDVGRWRLRVNDERVPRVVAKLLPASEWSSTLTFPVEDPGIDVVCIELFDVDGDAFELVEGDELDLRWGGRGPWTFPLGTTSVLDELLSLRKGAP
ncbi:MAG: hypothetical protein EA397_14185 [Deltaproteobacteria bacterium]|nr:MAG: hypothetical protein EA397_14185 [Deltaproteobacteria bacterium]